tara:strand:+ start:172 stop:657 length:486 start_codon:yes stop_codon:yes gene_type:complete
LENSNKEIAQSSPLYEYWKKSQDDIEEEKRLLMANYENPKSQLFIEEPYKWENLFQAIVREIKRGDINSIKGLNVLLDTLKEKEKEQTLLKLEEYEIFDNYIIKLIKNYNLEEVSGRKNILRFARILATIFANPYQIELKRKKNHLYERTGYILFIIRGMT